MDITAQPDISPVSGTHSTSPGTVRMTPGGVARNVAEAAHLVLKSLTPAADFQSKRPLLISPIGRDAFAAVLNLETKSRGMRADGLINFSPARTAVCNMYLDSKGDLQTGVADMRIISDIDSGVDQVSKSVIT